MLAVFAVLFHNSAHQSISLYYIVYNWLFPWFKKYLVLNCQAIASMIQRVTTITLLFKSWKVFCFNFQFLNLFNTTFYSVDNGLESKMRSVFSGSYSALNNQGGREPNEFDGENDVYRSTTRPSFDGGDIRVLRQQQQQRSDRLSVINSMKKFFRGNGSGGRLTASQSVFVLPNIHEHSTSYVPQVQLNSRTGGNYNRLNSR